ncbi:MAG TPA: hypothetical protein VHT00_23200, partial [Stellaceae bacterium]|nr:hypothetical protein [Stellaceae bacterium]
VLLNSRRGSLAAKLLNIRCDVQRLHAGDRRNTRFFAPKQELARGLAVGTARVFVANLRGKKFPKAGLSVGFGSLDELWGDSRQLGLRNSARIGCGGPN